MSVERLHLSRENLHIKRQTLADADLRESQLRIVERENLISPYLTNYFLHICPYV